MVTTSTILVIEIVAERSICLKLITAQGIKGVLIEPPQGISEGLWKTLPKWINSSAATLAGICLVENGAVATYATQRTVLSVINTLGMVERIPVMRCKNEGTFEDYLNQLQKTKVKEVPAQYA